MVDRDLEARTTNKRQLARLRPLMEETRMALALRGAFLPKLHITAYARRLLPVAGGVARAVLARAFAEVPGSAERELFRCG
jgi:hypothetical protein